MESICRATLLENGAGDAAHNASNINGNNKARPVGLFGRPSERDRMRMNSKFGGKGEPARTHFVGRTGSGVGGTLFSRLPAELMARNEMEYRRANRYARQGAELTVHERHRYAAVDG